MASAVFFMGLLPFLFERQNPTVNAVFPQPVRSRQAC
jgi:hypothetical protein